MGSVVGIREITPTVALIPVSAPLGSDNVSKLVHGGSDLVFGMIAAKRHSQSRCPLWDTWRANSGDEKSVCHHQLANSYGQIIIAEQYGDDRTVVRCGNHFQFGFLQQLPSENRACCEQAASLRFVCDHL